MTTTLEPPAFIWGEKHRDPTIRQVPLEKIHVPVRFEREDSPREDEALLNSIRKNGVEQPGHAIREPDGTYTLVKGTRRLKILYVLRKPTMPIIEEPPAPEGVDPAVYQNRLRFHLSIRQDLTPSQRAEFIVQAMEKFQMTQKDVAVSLGIDPGSVSNYLAIRHYHPSVVADIDAGKTTLFAARSLDGVKMEFQPRIYRSLRREFQSLAGGKLHKLVRAKFNPKRFPDYYVSPEKTLEKLARKQKGRKSRKRPKLTKNEKDVLANDLGVKEAELRDVEAEIRYLRRVNMLAGPIAHAILRNEAIAAQLPQDKLEEVHVFSEAY